MLLAAIGILARAGGGQGFGGGGGGGGGARGFSGGGGGGGLFFFGGGGGGGGTGGGILLALVVIGLLLFFVTARVRRGSRVAEGPITEHPYAHTDGPAYRPGTVPVVESGEPQAAVDPAPGLDAIRAHDPGFDLDAFKASVERSFFLVQQGWTELDPSMTRRVMADGIWQQHKAQIDHYKESGTRNVLDGMAIGKVTIRSATSDQAHDTITCRILATCADYDIEVASGKVVRGNKHEMTPFQEDWVFQRSSRAVTKPDGGTLDQKCPNCGAPLDLDLAGVCHYCRAPVMSGEYDWVLTRIDQV